MAVYRFNKETKKIEKKEDEHPPYVAAFPLTYKGYSNGKHRRTSPKVHSNPTHGAGGGAGGTTTLTLADWAKLSRSLLPIYEPKPTPPPHIPDAGIRTGEITAYRVWRVIGNHLHSLVADYIWLPGATEIGDINQVVDIWLSYLCLDPYNVYGGIYAFKGENEVAARALIDKDVAVIGTVKLWGEVVEHERGYRAQFAKITFLTATKPGLDHILQPYLDAINDHPNRR